MWLILLRNATEYLIIYVNLCNISNRKTFIQTLSRLPECASTFASVVALSDTGSVWYHNS
jgi:hypothetical protein